MRLWMVLVGAAALPFALFGCAAGAPAPVPTAASAPAFPTFPTVAGTVLERSMPAAGDWLLRVHVADAGDGYAAAKAALVAGGYTLTKDRSGTGGGGGQACTDRLCVTFTATEDPTAGPSVEYEVFHSTGVVG